MSRPPGAAGLRAAIERRLAGLIDPGAGLDIMRMGLVRELQIAGDGAVSLIFRPSSPVCPVAFSLAPAIMEAIEAIPGVRVVRMRVENFKRAAELEALLAADGKTGNTEAKREEGDNA